MRDRGGAKRPLSLAPDAQNGALGKTGFHSHFAEAAHHEAAAVPAGQTHVRCTIVIAAPCMHELRRCFDGPFNFGPFQKFPPESDAPDLHGPPRPRSLLRHPWRHGRRHRHHRLPLQGDGRLHRAPGRRLQRQLGGVRRGKRHRHVRPRRHRWSAKHRRLRRRKEGGGAAGGAGGRTAGGHSGNTQAQAGAFAHKVTTTYIYVPYPFLHYLYLNI